MSDIKDKLRDLVTDTMIPEVESYTEELHELLERNEHTEEDLEIIKDMESFLVELQNILAVLDEDSLPQEEYQRIYEKIMKNIEEHHEH